jgi:predicted permease
MPADNSFWNKVSYSIRALFLRKKAESELDSELRFHLESQIENNIRAGMSREDARQSAQREFGAVELAKEECRDERGTQFFEQLSQDVRFGARMLWKNPGFTAVAVLTLALGIGANTAVFSIVNAELLRPLPFAKPNQLVDLYLKTRTSDQTSVPYPTFLFWQRESRTMQSMAVWTYGSFDLTGMGEAEHLSGRTVSGDFFSVFGVQPILGRNFREEDERPGAAPVVLVSEGFWKRKFGASPTIIGKVMTLNQTDFEVIGVIPSTFRLWSVTDVYVPAGRSENSSANYNGPAGIYAVIGRLRSDATLVDAKSDLARVFRDFATAYPDSVGEARGVSIYSLKQDIIGDLQPTLLLLLGAVGFVLLIACANIANLLLARSIGRAREFAIRAALGASRRRVVCQLLTENLMLYCIGAGLGILFAAWGTHFVSKVFPAALPDMLPVALDLKVLTFALVVSAFTGFLFGLAPALKSTNPNLQNSLSEGSRGIASGHHLTQRIFIVAEISLALVLLIGAGLMVRTMHRIWTTDPGFDPHNVSVFSVSFPPLSKIDPEAMRERNRQLETSLAGLPGVESCSQGFPPMVSDGWARYWVEGQPKPKNTSDMNAASFFPVSHDYFRVMRIPIRQGRVFSDRDNHSAAMVIVVDENLARHLFPGQNPIGKRLNMAIFGSAEIVGVVQHVKQFGLVSDSQAKIQDQIYQPFEQLPDLLAPVIGGEAVIVMRTSVPPSSLLSAIRATVGKSDNRQVVFAFRQMGDVLISSQATRRFETFLLGAFSAIALLLATIGIYGIVSHLAAQRTHEIGIRIALGAQRWDILGIVIGQSGRMALTAIAIGIAASIGLTHLIANRLFGVSPTDPLTFTLVAAALLSVTLTASYIPARRATRVDPMTALRNE